MANLYGLLDALRTVWLREPVMATVMVVLVMAFVLIVAVTVPGVGEALAAGVVAVGGWVARRNVTPV